MSSASLSIFFEIASREDMIMETQLKLRKI